MIAWRIKKVVKKTKTYFDATYKKHNFKIKWDWDRREWSILVIAECENGGIVYHGWWGNNKYDIDDAIYEAMRGSKLI